MEFGTQVFDFINTDSYVTFAFYFQNPVTNICIATNKQLLQLVEWAKHIPHFTSLPLQDQVALLRAGWNELLIAGFSHRSIDVRDGIVLATGLVVQRYVFTILVNRIIYDLYKNSVLKCRVFYSLSCSKYTYRNYFEIKSDSKSMSIL